MKIKFPGENELSSDEAFKAYGRLIDSHLYFLNKQSDCEFFYWKVTTIYIFVSIALFFFEVKGMTSTPLLWVLFSGIGCLLMFLQNMRMDLNYGTQAASCLERGLRIEKQFDYPNKLLKSFQENRDLHYRGNLLSRIFPIGVVALSLIVTGTILGLKISIWFGSCICIFSMSTLIGGASYFINKTRKIFYEEVNS